MTGQNMVYDQATGQWVPMQVYQTPPVQPAAVNGNVAPAPTAYAPQQPAVPHYQQAAQAAPPANIFAQQDTSNALAWLQDDDEKSSMDDVGGDSVPTIKMNDMGWIVKRIDGIDLPPQPSVDVVIIGVGPRGGGVYRTYYGNTYNKNETTKPICVSYDGKTPSRSSEAVQCGSCDVCPHNIKGSGPNDSKACKYSMYFAVVDVADPNRIYRLRLSATPLFNKEIDPQGYHTVPTYKTFLQQHGATWEKVITRVSCPYGKNGGFRFNATGFITPELHQRIKELKQMISLNLIVDLNAAQQNEQLQLAVNGQHVAQIPVAQLPVQPAATVTPAVAQPAPAVPTPPPAPVAPPAPPAPVTPPPAPVSLKDQWAAHPALSPEVKAWIANPAVSEQQAHDYLAANFPAVLAPVAPAVPTPPPAPSVPAPSAPVAPAAPAQPVAPVAPQPLPATPPAEPAPSATPAPTPAPMAAPVQPAPANNAVVDSVIAELLGGDDLSAIK